MIDIDTASELQPAPTPRVSGRAVVFGMFAFGIGATGSLWLYWTLHTGPFRPLQKALAAEFPHSVPRVEGGQRKMHKHTPRILRVTLRVDFDPETETSRGQRVLDRIEEIARQHVDLSSYDVLEAYLFQGVPESALRQKEYQHDLRPIAR